ncbi:carboxymuconolactone decarboxylase family protein [Candidatus Palauibacter sp.]|uniref:carboxymuconolactone decarboxylase family protein n=1 Tax=Candidatus Palauibacter sp. TaxID=3101350 RepID=UPI003B0187D8
MIAALATDHATAELDDEDRAMLDYAARLTLAPGSVNESDVDRLKAHGFDDRAIHDICAVTAYYAFVNRIADGLGVELEDEGG